MEALYQLLCFEIIMRKIVFAAALFVASLANASAPIDGWYTSAFGGYAYVPGNIDINQHGLNYNHANFQSGFDAGANFGYKSNPMRYEGELTYLKANTQNFKVNNVLQWEPSGYSNAVLGLANVYYDFNGLTETFQPFLGAGIGYAWVQDKLSATGPMTASYFNGSSSAFAYQATGGITYNFAENYALSLGYRYIGTTHVSDLGQLFQAHLANLGAVYRFDGNNYK